MRKIDPVRFQVATQGTSREINRQIVLNLVRAHQPISRADLARTMGVRRGSVSLIVNDLLQSGLIIEGAVGKTVRGRKPTFLHIDSRRRTVIAVDVRASQTYLMLADLLGKPLTGVIRYPTVTDPREFVTTLARRIRALVSEHGLALDACEGVGVSVPGMIEHSTMRVLHAPQLGWRNVDLREPLAAAIGLRIEIENSGRACALAQVWEERSVAARVRNLVFVSVSDGVGVGVVVNGELLRGRRNIAGEFAHMPFSLDGPRCSCGATGCWEAHISNLATLTRYFGRSGRPDDEHGATIDTLIARARDGEKKAVAALQASAKYLGLGLGGIVNIIDPDCVFIGGEITTAWDLIEPIVRTALAERALTPAAASTDIVIVSAEEHPRLRGAAMLVAAPTFAAPVVA